MTDWIEHFRTATRGLSVTHVWRGHGSALFIELGALAPTIRRNGSYGEPKGVIGVMIEWSWRIEDGRSIACGSWSDEVLWEPTFARIKGRKVEDLATFGDLPELVLSLAGGHRVSSFMTAEGDPAWVLYDRHGPQTITACCRAGTVVVE